MLDAFAVRERPRRRTRVPGFHCTFLPGRPSSPTPANPTPIFSGTQRPRTMMQSCASAAKASRRRAHSPQRHENHGFRRTSPPRTVIGDPSPWSGSSRNRHAIDDVYSMTRVHHAGRMATPSGTTPSRASRHNAISSLRASATIMVLRAFGECSVLPCPMLRRARSVPGVRGLDCDQAQASSRLRLQRSLIGRLVRRSRFRSNRATARRLWDRNTRRGRRWN
jgi:hypothetical protein